MIIIKLFSYSQINCIISISCKFTVHEIKSRIYDITYTKIWQNVYMSTAGAEAVDQGWRMSGCGLYKAHKIICSGPAKAVKLWPD